MNVTPGRGKSWYKLQWGSGSRWQEQPTGPGERNQRKGHGENLKEKAEKDRRKQGTGARRQETGFVMDLISSRAPAVTQLIAPHVIQLLTVHDLSWSETLEYKTAGSIPSEAQLYWCMSVCGASHWSTNLTDSSLCLESRTLHRQRAPGSRMFSGLQELVIACNEATVMAIILTPSLYYN